jgi:hypothetical protein
MKTKITCLSDLLRSSEFDAWQYSSLGNDLFINDAERAERIHAAAEDGADGSTHAEHIQDWRDANDDFARDTYRAQFSADGYPDFAADELADTLRDYISAEIDDTEAWHVKNGSLETQCG